MISIGHFARNSAVGCGSSASTFMPTPMARVATACPMRPRPTIPNVEPITRGPVTRVREGKWKRVTGPRVICSTLGIVGLGRIGQAVATRAIGVGMKVLAFEPQPNAEFLAKWPIEIVALDDLLARSDYVSIHSPLTPQTQHLINSQTLAKMKPGSVLI